jgi:hypothetical protein
MGESPFGPKFILEPKGVRARRKSLDSTYSFIAMPSIKSSSLKVVHEVYGLKAAAGLCLSFGSDEEHGGPPAAAHTWSWLS